MTRRVKAIPLEGPRNLDSSFSLNLTRPAPRMMASASGAALSSEAIRASSVSSSVILFCKCMTYVLGTFLPLVMSKYSHVALCCSHGTQRGRPGSHLLFRCESWAIDQATSPMWADKGSASPSYTSYKHSTCEPLLIPRPHGFHGWICLPPSLRYPVYQSSDEWWRSVKCPWNIIHQECPVAQTVQLLTQLHLPRSRAWSRKNLRIVSVSTELKTDEYSMLSEIGWRLRASPRSSNLGSRLS